MKLTFRPPAVCLFLVLAACPNAWALPDAEAAAGRLIVRRYADAVVVVKLSMVLKIAVGDRPPTSTEQKIDLNGTVLASDGLTVTSLSAIEPKFLFDAVRPQLAPPAMPVDLESSELKDVRLQLADGTEVPARVVWRDATRDLAFLGPEHPLSGGRTFTCVNLGEAPEAAMLLGSYYHLSRLSEALQRTPVIRPSTVTGIIERPRRMLLFSTDSLGDVLGCPVFDTQGHVLGICVRYLVDGASRGLVIVPSADVLASASQMSAM
ncbi:MAG TPA: serine protease [Opitutaceae bacterium]|nr:serine protease [Opitutaceae bacterium]